MKCTACSADLLTTAVSVSVAESHSKARKHSPLLGRGGMGEVYRADDLKLAHPVALNGKPINKLVG